RLSVCTSAASTLLVHDPAPTAISPISLHDALPISGSHDLVDELHRRHIDAGLQGWAESPPVRDLAYGLVEDPLTDLMNHAGVFGEGNEDARRHQALLRMLPEIGRASCRERA